MRVNKMGRYLKCCCACILFADCVSIVGPHDLINPVAFKRQRLLRRHHTQFLQLQEGKDILVHCNSPWLHTAIVHYYMEEKCKTPSAAQFKTQPENLDFHYLFISHLM